VKHLALITSFLLLSVAAMAQTYSDASLNGPYAFQQTNPQTYTWFKLFKCPTNSAITFGVTGSQTTQQVGYGVVTFDGKGNLSITQTTIGNFNSSASANTTSVTWNSSCQVTAVNTGHVVYAASTTKTMTTTYSVQSNGTGTITSSGGTSTFILAGTNSSGISTTIFIAGKVVNGQTINAITAVHQ
jgi:hypothetical protein